MNIKIFSRQVFLFLVLMILFGIISVLNGQDVSFDLRNYHWYNAYAFLNDRMNFDIAPAGLQTYLNPLVDVFNYCVVKLVGNPKYVAFILGALGGVAVFILFKIVEMIFAEENKFKWAAIWFALLIGVSGAAGRSQLGTTMNEYVIAIFVLLGIYGILRAMNVLGNVKSYYYILFGGLFLGMAVGLKLTAATFALGASLSLILVLNRTLLINFKLPLFLSLGLIIGFMSVDGFWLYKIYHYFKNPFFPFYNNIFQSPDAIFALYADKRFVPQNYIQYLFYPFFWLRANTLVNEVMARDARFALVLLCLLYLGLKFSVFRNAKRPSSAIVFLLLFWFFSYVIWLIKFSIYRYVIPIELLSGVVIIYTCLHLISHVVGRYIVTAGMTLLLMFTTIYPEWGHMPFSQQFIVSNTPVIPENSLVIFIGEDQAFSYLADSFPTSTHFIRLSHLKILESKAIAMIQNFKGPIFLLQKPGAQNHVDEWLSRLKLSLVSAHCRTNITSNLEAVPASLCPLER